MIVLVRTARVSQLSTGAVTSQLRTILTLLDAKICFAHSLLLLLGTSTQLSSHRDKPQEATTTTTIALIHLVLFEGGIATESYFVQALSRLASSKASR